MKDKTLHITPAEASKPLLLRAVCVVVGLVCAVNTYGAMTKDLNKGIQSITYNELSLPLKIEIATLALGGTNEYKYTSTGIKLHVTHNWNANINGSVIGGSSAEQRQETDYIGNKIYENGKLKMILTDNGYIQDGEYFFYIKDHLGNNRIVVNESGHVVQSTDYYPYGLPTPDAVSTETQPYKYNGKELDNISGLNLYDYSARHYDPVIGSFTTVDPHAERYYAVSPYAYVAGNPINAVDPDGKDYWHTNDPDMIRQFINAMGSGQQTVDLSKWNHTTDAEFTANLTFNDETGKAYTSYGAMIDGTPAVVGVSFDTNLKPGLDMWGLPYKGLQVYSPIGDDFWSWSAYHIFGQNSTMNFLAGTYGVNTSGRITGIVPSAGTPPVVGIKGGAVLKGGKLFQKMGKAKGNMTGNHARQNEQARAIAKELGVSNDPVKVRQIHDYISKQGWNYQEALQEVKYFFGY